MHHFFHKKIDRRPAYLAVGALSALFLIGGYFAMDYFVRELVKGTVVTEAVTIAKPLAPTTAEYEAEAEAAMRPLITYLASRNSPVPVGDTVTVGLVNEAQNAMLDLRVPAERRDAHFRAVALLDTWRVYLTKGEGDYGNILGRTQQLAQDSPWLLLNVAR
jgi:hypothetical protein